MDIKDLLLAMKGYIEDKEEAIDAEWGSCQTADKLSIGRMMPKLYYDILEILKDKNNGE